MKKYICLFKDDVAGTFEMYGVFNNVELAKREFKRACSSGVPADDLSLYVGAILNTENGSINAVHEEELGNFPFYVMRGFKDEV